MGLFHVRRGAGEPLLLIPGMSGNHLHWGEPFLSALEGDFELIAFDHRGVGDSPRAEGPFALADLAEDAAGLIEELGLGRVHVLGISMGGMVAQELVLRHPERLRTLTLGCTSAGGPEGPIRVPGVIEGLVAAGASGDVQRALRAAWEANVSAAYAADGANWDSFVERAMLRPVAVEVILLQMQAIAGHDTHSRLAGIEAPTLVVHGDEDRMLPLPNGEAVAAAIPGARLEVLEGVGHMFWIEQPERSAALVREHALATAQ